MAGAPFILTQSRDLSIRKILLASFRNCRSRKKSAKWIRQLLRISGGGIQIKKRSGKFPRIDVEGGASCLLHRGRLQSSDEQGMHKVRWLAQTD
jgi:hypothetical protein